MFEFLGNLVIGISIAAVSSWITVQLSRKKFRTERLWEKKIDAYERLIEALHQSKKFSSEHLIAEIKSRDIDEARDFELRKLAQAAREVIDRAADIGGFVMSEKSVAIVKNYQSEAEKLDTCQFWYEYIDMDHTITERCLNRVIQAAKEDLER